MTDQTAPCRTTRHCADHGFCHRCSPQLASASRYLVKAMGAAGVEYPASSDLYAQLAATVRDAARQASTQQPDAEETQQCPAAEFEDYGQQCQKVIGHELHTFEQQSSADTDRYDARLTQRMTPEAAGELRRRLGTGTAVGRPTPAVGQLDGRDCPSCEAGIVHTEHCPTPETHNWGCGCPTDRQQGIEATRAKLSTPCAYCGHSYNWHTLRGGCQVKAGEARCGCGAFVTPAVGQQDATQPTTDETEAHPPRAAWRIELRDAEGWAISGLVRPDRDEVARYLASRRKQRPDAEFRLVREDTTWTVEEDETR